MRNILTFILIGINSIMYSQVGINTNLPKTTLDINKSLSQDLAEGFLTIRISGNDLAAKDKLYGEDQNSSLIYATEVPTTSTPKTSNIKTPGFYYYKSSISKWVAFAMPKFFYMPSILFDTTKMGAQTKDLYQLYYNQFTNPSASSTGATGKIPVVGKDDLEYYITSYDTTVFGNVTINADGVMNYSVLNNATEASFLNIIFVLK